MPTEKYNSRSPIFVVATPVGGTVPNRLATVVTETDISMTSNSVTFEGQVTDVGNPAYTARGFYFKQGTGTPDATDNDIPVSGTDTNPYSFTANTLSGYPISPSTTYSYVAYAENLVGIATGDVYTFTTPSSLQLPTVETTGDSNVTDSSATLIGNVTAVGFPSYSSKGFYWMQGVGTPDVTDNTLSVSGTGTGQFSGGLTGLSASTTYSFVAFAINSSGTATGVVDTFTTAATAPTTFVPSVTTNTATAPTESSILLNGNVTNVGNPAYSEKGFVYIQGSGTPTILDNKVIEYSTGTGSYSFSLTGLLSSQLYTYRAYATNTVGTAYGSNVQFTTAAAPTCDGGTLFFQNHQISGGNAALATGQISYSTSECGATIPTVSLLLTNNDGEWTSTNQVTSIALYEGTTNVSSLYTLGKTLVGDVMNITFGGNFPSAYNDGNHTYSFHLTVDTTEQYVTTITLPTTSASTGGDIEFVTSAVTADTSTSYPASRDGSHNTSTLSPQGISGAAYKYTIVYTASSGYYFTGLGNLSEPTVTASTGVGVNKTAYTSSTITVEVTGTIQSSDVSATITCTGSAVAAPATSATLRYRLQPSTTWLSVPSSIEVSESQTYDIEVTPNGSYFADVSNTTLTTSMTPSGSTNGTVTVHQIEISNSLAGGGDQTGQFRVYPQGGGSLITAARFDYFDI